MATNNRDAGRGSNATVPQAHRQQAHVGVRPVNTGRVWVYKPFHHCDHRVGWNRPPVETAVHIARACLAALQHDEGGTLSVPMRKEVLAAARRLRSFEGMHIPFPLRRRPRRAGE